MKQDTVTIVCDKCGKIIIRDDVYGYGHACPVYLKEIKQQIDKMYNPYIATPEELRIRRDLRDYANAIYSPMPALYRRPSSAYYTPRDCPRRLS